MEQDLQLLLKNKMINIIFIFALLGIQLFLLSHLQFTAWPEMFSYPYLRNHGYLLYQDMIYPYPPLLAMILSFIYRYFDYSVEILKYFSWTTNLLSSLVLYFITKKVTKSNLFSLIGLFLYSLLQPFLEGNMLWFDTAIVPFILLGFYFSISYLKISDVKWLLASSLFFSIAALIKQTSVLFLIIFFIFLIFRRIPTKHLFLYCLIPILAVFPFLIRVYQEKSLEWFFQWTILYPLFEWKKFPNYVQMFVNNKDLLVLQLLLVPPFVFTPFNLKIFKDKIFLLSLLFLVSSLISIYPRFSYFHFQSALAINIIFWIYISSKISKKLALLSASLLIFIFFPLIFKPLITVSWDKEARFMSFKDIELAAKIKKIAGVNKIYLLGLNSNLYVLSGTLPPKPWVDNFGWYLEIPGVQEEVLLKWDENPPYYIIWRKPSAGNWFDLGVYQPQKFVDYFKMHYNFKEELEPEVGVWERKN